VPYDLLQPELLLKTPVRRKSDQKVPGPAKAPTEEKEPGASPPAGP